MNNNAMEFPQYRKMSNDKAFYKITSDKTFDEIQIIGKKAVFHHVIAEQYPEMLRIQDMLNMDNDWFLESNEVEYNEFLVLLEI